jgi:hypothetical protein
MGIKQLVQAGFGVFGLRLTRLSNEPKHYYDLLDLLFLLLKRRSFSPNHIVDVGANHGYWTRTALKYFPDAYYTLIEPQDYLRENVEDLLAREDGKIRWIGAGASDKCLLRFLIVTLPAPSLRQRQQKLIVFVKSKCR